jgi:hypothetical protein
LEVSGDNLVKFIEFNEKSKQINPVKMVTEERLLIENIRTSLSKNRSEIEVSFLSDMLLYFEDYLKTSISADDYAYLQSRFDKFLSMWEKYSLYNKTMADLKEDLTLLKEYYAVNDDRNEIFLKALFKDRSIGANKNSKAVFNETVSALAQGKKNVIVCVTGGYHSKGMADLLAKDSISYAVLTPMVSGGVKDSWENYEREARQQSVIFSQSLALSMFSQIISNSISKNDAQSREMAAKFFISAAQSLEKYPFSRDNVLKLVNYLNEAAGGYYNFVYDENTGDISMHSKDGLYSESFINVSETAEGNILIKNKYSAQAKDKILLKDYGEKLTSEKMSEFISNFSKIFQISSLNFGADLFAPRVYALGVNFVNWAAQNNIFFDINAINGLSFDLAEKYGFTDLVDQNPALAKQPESWQNAAVEKRLKELDAENGNMDEITKLLFATNLFNEFLPVTHDTRMMYAAYPNATAAKILDEAQALRNGERLDYTAMPQAPGTAGVRGAIGSVLTLSSVQIIAQAQADIAIKEAREKGIPVNTIKVVIGGDTRYAGNEFQQAAAGVFAANGFDVELFDSQVPTPLISFYTRDGGLAVNITGSHNKGIDTGYKFTIGGAQAPDDYKDMLVAAMERVVEAERLGEKAVKYVSPQSKESKIKTLTAIQESA